MKIFNHVVYKIVLALAKIIVFIIYPHKIHGKKNLKLDEPYIFYANHISAWDPIIVASTILKRKAYFMSKEELYKTKISSWFFHAVGGFPVKRGTPDMKAIKTSISHLNNGDVMMIFPEGTRNTNKDGSLMSFHNGVGIIAHKAKVKLIPCYINNKGGYGLFKRLDVSIGEPINLSEYLNKPLNKENLNDIMNIIRKRMEDLIA
jgi:1-acyl-sn-glycerol-3-phosphate acyltransferase